MNKSIGLLFAYRDRDELRILHCMNSLEKQTDLDFQVIFVDYGSDDKNSIATREILSAFSFVQYFYVAHPGLVWNKSKAFNYGIRKSEAEYIITADIDLIFHPGFIESTRRLANPDTFTIFSYAYLQEKETPKDNLDYNFTDLQPSHIGNITGSGLYPKASLEKIHGFDEFYHFYGSEDEDLFIRLEHLGLQRKQEERNMLTHQWHPRYPFEERNELTKVPKINNIRRINLEHYNKTKETKKIIPFGQKNWGECYTKKDFLKLQKPIEVFTADCRESSVIYFLHEFLSNCKGVIEVSFSKKDKKLDPKQLIKGILGKETEPIWNLKQVNDEILRLILFRYRHHNYSYKVAENLDKIIFTIRIN